MNGNPHGTMEKSNLNFLNFFFLFFDYELQISLHQFYSHYGIINYNNYFLRPRIIPLDTSKSIVISHPLSIFNYNNYNWRTQREIPDFNYVLQSLLTMVNYLLTNCKSIVSLSVLRYILDWKLKYVIEIGA